MKTKTPTLYFLRSSEQYILNKLLPTSLDCTQNIEFFGFTNKDLGLYALVDNTIAAALWVRLKDTNIYPVLNLCVKEEFRNQGIAKLMMEQLFVEASNVFETLEVKKVKDENFIQFFEKFGFKKQEDSMIKLLEKKVQKDMYDDYSSCKWMEP